MPVLTPIIPGYTGSPGGVISWPAHPAVAAARMRWGVSSSRTAWASIYTGQSQRITHLADRLQVSVDLTPVTAAEAGDREAYFMAASSAGNWIELWHLQRPAPLGTLRGAPVVALSTAAGARVLSITTTAGATLEAGDVLGSAGQLIQCGYGGAVADGAGAMLMPLVLPLRRALAAGAALTWDKPKASFQVINLDPTFDYTAPKMQMGLTVDLAEVYA